MHIVDPNVRVLGGDTVEEPRFRDHAGGVGGEARWGWEEAGTGGGERDEGRFGGGGFGAEGGEESYGLELAGDT